MLLDVIGALVLGAICTTDIAVLIGLAVIRPAAKVVAFVIVAAWFSLIFAVAALGGFAAGVTGPFPAPVIPFLILIIGGLVAWFGWPAFRNALLSVPLWALIGVNAFRILGVFFLILHHQGRLAAPFATSAGWGDVITGLVAIPLAAALAWKSKLPLWLLAAWTAFGTLDLIVSITLGALSAPGTPFRVFTEAPGTVAMGTLPWAGVPTLLVPLYLMTLLTIAVRLRTLSARQATGYVRFDRRPPADRIHVGTSRSSGGEDGGRRRVQESVIGE
jgi:hypothetical protein